MSTAEQAKQRLQWCVAQRRNGGAWIEVGYHVSMILSTEDGLNWTQETYEGAPNRYRWRYA